MMPPHLSFDRGTRGGAVHLTIFFSTDRMQLVEISDGRISHYIN